MNRYVGMHTTIDANMSSAECVFDCKALKSVFYKIGEVANLNDPDDPTDDEIAILWNH